MPLWTLLSMPPWPLATLSGHNSIASPLLLPYLFPLWKNATQSSGAQLSASRLLTSKTKTRKRMQRFCAPRHGTGYWLSRYIGEISYSRPISPLSINSCKHSQTSLGYCWSTLKCRTFVVPIPSWQAQDSGASSAGTGPVSRGNRMTNRL
jgi:hypothetical protein